MEDQEIVALYWKRDESAIMRTKEKYDRYLYRIAQNILEDMRDAEESVSDTYVGAWNSMPPQKPAVLRTYLGRITRNLSLKRFRAYYTQKRRGGETALLLDELSEMIPDTETTEGKAERKELIRLIQAFLTQLKPEQRMMFLMRYWYLYSVADTAKKLGFSQSKVKMTLLRTREKLRDLLIKEELL
ncbi:RNA polymerase sigma factor [Ruminococcus sp.]|uniref:RNA polymerase sigma factor n=1 Tax=Ruminococcus sp. TaxID=41978 RepID=UPI003890A829